MKVRPTIPVAPVPWRDETPVAVIKRVSRGEDNRKLGSVTYRFFAASSAIAFAQGHWPLEIGDWRHGQFVEPYP